jgi:hypothetical protein
LADKDLRQAVCSDNCSVLANVVIFLHDRGIWSKLKEREKEEQQKRQGAKRKKES